MAKADLLWRVTRVVDGFSRSHEREEEEQSEALPTLGRVRFDQDQGGFEFVKCSEIQTGQSGSFGGYEADADGAIIVSNQCVMSPYPMG